MKEAKYTPGPWEVEYIGTSSGHDEYAILARGAALNVATVQPVDPDITDAPEGYTPQDVDDYTEGPVTMANADLIAAAPDMYEALNALRGHFILDEHDEFYAPDIAELVRAALNKAEGR